MGIYCMAKNVERWDGEGYRREVQKGEDIVYLWLIHVEV